MAEAAKPLTVAIGGLGAIGLPVAQALDRGIPGLELAAVSAADQHGAATRIASFSRRVPVLPLGDLARMADIVIESAPARVFAEVAEPAIEAGRTFMPLSVGVLLSRQDLIDRAAETGARIIVPTGALLGLDAVRAAAEGTIHGVTMITRKPPRGLKGAPYIEEHHIHLDDLREPVRVFAGSAREAALGFPANVNVAAALSLAGIGPDNTQIEIWADPSIDRNTHRIRVEAEAARFEMSIESVPSPDNPRTGLLTPLSVIATLRGLTAPLRVGT